MYTHIILIMWGNPQLSWTKSNDLDAKRTQKAPKIIRYKQHQPAVSCSFYLQIQRMSWKGGSKSTEHNRAAASALALLLPWCTAMASVVWRSKRCLSVVDRKWCCPKPACTSAADDCMLKVMIYKQIIALPLCLSLCWCWAEWQSFGLSWPWGPLPGTSSHCYLWQGLKLEGTMHGWHVRFTCQYQSCAPVALCSQWRGRRGKTYSVSLQSRQIWPSEKSWGVYGIVYVSIFCSSGLQLTIEEQGRVEENLAWLLTLPWTRISPSVGGTSRIRYER